MQHTQLIIDSRKLLVFECDNLLKLKLARLDEEKSEEQNWFRTESQLSRLSGNNSYCIKIPKLYFRINRCNINSCWPIVLFQIDHLFQFEKPFNRNFNRCWWVDYSNFWRFSVRQTNNIKNSLVFRFCKILWLSGFGFTSNHFLIWRMIFSLLHNPNDETTFSKNVLILQKHKMSWCVLSYIDYLAWYTNLQIHKLRSIKIKSGTPIINITELKNYDILIFEYSVRRPEAVN